MDNDLLDLLACELGEIYRWEEECPGVYYLSILTTIEEGGEYYAVLEGAPITQEARAIGRRLKDVPVLLYPLEAEDGAWTVVEYEILRYQTARGLPMPEGKSLREAALYGAELCPFSPPGAAPSGTARWTTACTGSRQSSAWRCWRCAIQSGMGICRKGCGR